MFAHPTSKKKIEEKSIHFLFATMRMLASMRQDIFIRFFRLFSNADMILWKYAMKSVAGINLHNNVLKIPTEKRTEKKNKIFLSMSAFILFYLPK